jgi:hypothetical protein
MTADELLVGRFPRRIADVLALMRALEDALPPGDGVALFLRLYWPVTEDVEAAAASPAGLGEGACDRPEGMGAVLRRAQPPANRADPVRPRGHERSHQP